MTKLDRPEHTRPAATAESRSQLTRVARGGAINLVGAVIAAVSGFGFVAVVARSLDPESAGVLFSATSVFVVVVGVAVFGADTGLAHFILRFEATDRSADIPTVLGCARRPVAATSVMIAGVVFVLADPASELLGLRHPQAPLVVRVLAVTVPFAALAQLALSETRAIGLMRPTVVIENVMRAGAQLAIVAVAGLAGGGLVAMSVGWGLPYIAAACIALPFSRRVLRRRGARWSLGPATDPAVVRIEFRRYSMPRGLARLLQIIVQRADIVIVAAMLGPAEAAFYAAATRFVIVGQLASQAISNVLMPRLAQLLARRDLDTVGLVFKTATSWSMALAWPLYAITAAAAGLYLEIFGEDYAAGDGVPVVVVMAMAMAMATAAGALDTVLLMSGRSATSLINAAVAAVLDVALCLLLIPWLGILGAAVAWGVAVLAKNGLAFEQVRRALHLTPLSAGSLIVAVGVVMCYAIPVAALSLAGHVTVLRLMAVVAVGSVGYVALLWWARDQLSLSVFREVLPRRLSRRLADSP